MTASDIRIVAGEDRVAELARMLAGTSSETPAHASTLAELLAATRDGWREKTGKTRV